MSDHNDVWFYLHVGDKSIPIEDDGVSETDRAQLETAIQAGQDDE